MKDFLKQFVATHWMDSVKTVDKSVESDIIKPEDNSTISTNIDEH